MTEKKTGLAGSKITKAKSGNGFAITKGQNISSNLTMNYSVAANKIIPPNVQKMMESMFNSVGLKFDVSQIDLNDKNLNQKVAELRKTVELITTNSKLLPTMHKLLKEAMEAAGSMANFQRDVVISTLSNQVNIDRAQADVLVALAGFGKERNKIQEKLQAKIAKITELDALGHQDREITYGRQLKMLHASSQLIRDTNAKQVKSIEAGQQKRAERQRQEIEYLEVAK